ncbi:hypothetical protein [Ponticoccus alexandrii]|uniref:YIP1 family protein n=1 Tax=Ponticoccus alexandrii TaxID=1943633 RepID=A0ABX7FAX4_9RHOB|nr:hypothetical protein [Ponticoccus alexandrii]ETA49861.1 hypothetical protein P279_22405 [Rhodobacteraceae bacterium PD-2]QRF67021.1 YIP1 family protein [Ponticoccus alexandrii]
MSVTTDIAASFRGPGAVLRRIFAQPASEARALAFVMGGCGVMFVARWPALARQAHLQDQDLNMLLGGTLLAVVFFVPLILYALAFLVALVARAMGSAMTGYGSRVALFWALLAASPLMLLNGLVAGFIGPGPALTLVGLLWVVAFALFWIKGLRIAAEVGA